MTILKFSLNIKAGVQALSLPQNSAIVHVGMQDSRLCFWAVVDPRNSCSTRYFRVIGTGDEVSPPDFYVGTTQDGPFVWHLFEV